MALHIQWKIFLGTFRAVRHEKEVKREINNKKKDQKINEMKKGNDA